MTLDTRWTYRPPLNGIIAAAFPDIRTSLPNGKRWQRPCGCPPRWRRRRLSRMPPPRANTSSFDVIHSWVLPSLHDVVGMRVCFLLFFISVFVFIFLFGVIIFVSTTSIIICIGIYDLADINFVLVYHLTMVYIIYGWDLLDMLLILGDTSSPVRRAMIKSLFPDV